MGSCRGVMVEPWGRGQLVLWKAKELWKAHCKSCYFSYTMFQTQTNLKKVCVQKKTLNHSANPTLDFTFLQWSSHSFIQIPKVEIICSKCFQSRPAQGFNDFSRAGENCEIFYTPMEHSKWGRKKRERQAREREKECFDDLFVYFVTVMALGQCLRSHVDCQCLISFGKVAFLLYYGDNYDGEIIHTIIHFLQDGEQAHFSLFERDWTWGPLETTCVCVYFCWWYLSLCNASLPST